jgi:hypothetical protein
MCFVAHPTKRFPVKAYAHETIFVFINEATPFHVDDREKNSSL